MDDKRGRFGKTGQEELLGIESRRWRTPAKPKHGWGGYPTTRRKLLHWLGFILFGAVWIYIFVAFIRG
jgi:hypothetical protein